MAYQNPYLGKNPYLEGQIDAAQGDITRQYNMTTQPAYNSAMVRSGSFGNSGVQQLNENAQRNLQKSLGEVSNGMRSRDYENQQHMYQWDQGFNRNLFNDAYAQNMGNAQFGVGLLGTLNGYHQQDLANASQIHNTPLTYNTQFSNLANAAGGMGQTATQVQGTSSSPVTAALGGAQLGNAFQRYWQQQNNIGTSGNNYSGSSNDWTAPNYENQMDRGYTWGTGNM